MIIYIAIMMTCTNANLEQTISCTWGASEGVYKSKAQCEIEAPKTYRRSVKCIDVEVGRTCKLGACPEVRLK